MRYTALFVMASMLVVWGAGCTLITDFPAAKDAGGGETELYSLNLNIDDPVDVALLADANAQIVLSLDEPMPAEDDDSLLAGLLDTAIDLTIMSTAEGGISVDLTEGTRVDRVPSGEGEYRIELNSERDEVTITFRNEVSGRSLSEDGAYKAAIVVAPNYYFAIESFERDVTVVAQAD